MPSNDANRRRWLRGAGVSAILVGAAAGGVYLFTTRTAAPVEPVAAFLDRHWQRPLPPQGPVPAHFSALEASLDSAACAQCHATQYEDWSGSLHHQTMGAGVLWQLRLMSQAEANRCLDCHAPLAEQKALIALEHGWQGAPTQPPPAFVPPSLGHQGLVCAACHVRGHQRFGPPAPDRAVLASAPHDGFTPSAAFGDSRFCASCHQFPDDGPRTNGKLREDTWRQWQASPQAARGETCQSCHMPDRRHQWPGIHSPQMVQQALSHSLSVIDGEVTATLTNTGAGHFFPTYMVPKVTAQLVLVADTETLLDEAVIGWEVDLSLQQETFDTRLPPGAGVTLRARLPDAVPGARQVDLRVQVAPREHYERSFGSVLAQADSLDAGTLDAQTLGLLQQARDEARATRFEALRVSVPLTPAAPDH